MRFISITTSAPPQSIRHRPQRLETPRLEDPWAGWGQDWEGEKAVKTDKRGKMSRFRGGRYSFATLISWNNWKHPRMKYSYETRLGFFSDKSLKTLTENINAFLWQTYLKIGYMREYLKILHESQEVVREEGDSRLASPVGQISPGNRNNSRCHSRSPSHPAKWARRLDSANWEQAGLAGIFSRDGLSD